MVSPRPADSGLPFSRGTLHPPFGIDVCHLVRVLDGLVRGGGIVVHGGILVRGGIIVRTGLSVGIICFLNFLGSLRGLFLHLGHLGHLGRLDRLGHFGLFCRAGGSLLGSLLRTVNLTPLTIDGLVPIGSRGDGGIQRLGSVRFIGCVRHIDCRGPRTLCFPVGGVVPSKSR